MTKFMRRWVGLKNYIKEKLVAATCVTVVTGAIVLDKMSAKRQYLEHVWPFSSLIYIASPSVVVKWMKNNRGRVMSSMWGWDPATAERLQTAIAASDPEVVAKREAEKKVEEAGIGECCFCNEEIVKNDRLTWESDHLLEYCISARDHKHKPKIVWKVAE